MPHPRFASFPGTRHRRLRQSGWIRDLVRESTLSPANLIWPMFVIEGANAREPIASMPGVERLSVDLIVEQARRAVDLGIPCIALFPNTPDARKSPGGEEAWNPANLVNTATRAIKAAVPGLGVLLDVALDPYNSDGHDGIVENGRVLNDPTLIALVKQAMAQIEAGCDILGPSDMMDGRIGAIRKGLDGAGFDHVRIMAYAAKYASGFYGPFRDAIGSGSNLGAGDKRTYQMDSANGDEALREVAFDLAEGADMVMVKPGMPYLDIVRRVKDTFGVPTFAYQVSGEYAMIQGAVENGWLDGNKVWPETMLCFKRAGCSGVLTYAALAIARRLNGA